ncbi:putative cytochrome P450 [Setomelanomma holmii]|uniref:Cytochrome P450 n=1 Tax=Setomelanomma holmii TaxID=210430 RepID=A0A9P4LV55_9PLEO|nr:putative cytochrome P450 [Setomelanomma holmii]
MASSWVVDGFAATITTASILRVLALWVSYHLVRAVYNISPWHPLSHVPGPKIAAATILYEFWYDFVLRGTYTSVIRQMHGTYGPLVRISPNELHCNDAAFVDEVYASAGRKRDKQAHYLGVLAGPTTNSAFGTIDHDLHRVRRNAMNKFFSRAQITRLEPEMLKLTKLLCDKLLSPFNVTTAYSCFSSDMISTYCFGEPLGFIEQDGWEPNFREPMSAFLNTSYLFRFFPWVRGLVNVAPFLAPYLSGDIGILMKEMYINTPTRIRQAREDHEAGIMRERPSVFTDILASSLPEHEKTVDRLSGEGFSLTGAGTETTAWTLSVITFYVLSQPDVQRKLAVELKDVDPSNISWAALEKLPYLNAVVAEGLRLSYGVSSRTPRVPHEDLVYRGEVKGRGKVEHVIPKGTAIGMSAAIMHHNEDVFPNSDTFIPERWLDEQGLRRPNMDMGLLSFSKGSRQCLGINLAYCELFVSTAALVLRVFPHMKLHETTVDDVRYDHDLITAQAKKGSKGVQVVMI